MYVWDLIILVLENARKHWSEQGLRDLNARD